MIDLTDEDARLQVHSGYMGDEVWLVYEGTQVCVTTK
jgi:hypothetical protein